MTVGIPRRKVAAIKAIWTQERYLVSFRGGGKAFVKINHTDIKEKIRGLRMVIARERACLKVLRGLAVPELLTMSPRLLGVKKSVPMKASLVCTYVEGKDTDNAQLAPRQKIAIWLFILEQLVAFRRHGILYQDIKCTNIIINKYPLRATIVDFGSATAVRDGGRDIQINAYTAAFAAPETLARKQISERSLVYELGMLLAHMLGQIDNSSIRHVGLGRVEEVLASAGSRSLFPILKDCLAPQPWRRPLHFDAVLEKARARKIPDAIQRLWKDLRAPYVSKLSEVGLTPPPKV